MSSVLLPGSCCIKQWHNFAAYSALNWDSNICGWIWSVTPLGPGKQGERTGVSIGRISDSFSSVSAFVRCVFSFVKCSANEKAHHLVRWAASMIEYGGYPDVHEYYSDLVWIYVGIDPPSLFCALFWIKVVVVWFKKKKKKVASKSNPSYKTMRGNFVKR